MDLVGRKLGKYEVTEFIGQGGMAAVYKAFQPGVERHVAIKVMHPHLATSDDFVARFMQEARSSGKLHHPHVMPVIDCDSEAGVHYLVLNFIGGGTLEELIAKQKPLPMDQALQIAAQIGDALAYAHQHDMIHRDIKPANIMFMRDDAEHALLADFGIARLLNETASLTVDGAVVGTPNYMSPEAAQGETSDERSDIYSLGVVLYEMVTGQTPYQSETLYSFLMKQANDPLPPPTEINPKVPPAVEAVILKALAKEPNERFASAEAFVAAIRDASTTSIDMSGALNSNTKRTMNDQETKKRGWLPLALVGAGVLAVAIVTTFLLLRMDSGDEAAPEQTTLAEQSAPEEAAATESEAAPADAADAAESTESAEPTEPADSTESAENGSAPDVDAPDAGEGEAEDVATDSNPPESETATTETDAVETVETETATADSQVVDEPAGDESATEVSESSVPEEGSSEEGNEQAVVVEDESNGESTGSDETAEAASQEQAATAENDDNDENQVEAITRSVGALQIQAGADGVAFVLNLSQVPMPPANNHYELWLEDSEGAALNAGPLAMVGNAIAASGEIPVGQLVDFSSVLISIEPDEDDAPELMETVAFSNTQPSELLTSNSAATASTSAATPLDAPLDTAWVEALLSEALDEVLMAESHAGFLQDSLAEDDLDGARTHAEHVVNILEGEGGSHFGDLNRDDQTQNPGNGVGVMGYLGQLAAAGAGEENTNIAALTVLSETASSAVKQAFQVFAADTAGEVQPMSERLLELVLQTKGGIDVEGGGAALLALGQVAASQSNSTESFQTTSFNLSTRTALQTDLGDPLSRTDQPAAVGLFSLSLIEPSSPVGGSDAGGSSAGDGYGGSSGGSYGGASSSSATLDQPDNAYTSDYTITINEIPAAADGEVYEVWMQNAAGQLMSLGTSDIAGQTFANQLTFSGSTQEALLADYSQIIITRRPVASEQPNDAGALAEAIVYTGSYDPTLLSALRALFYASDMTSPGLLNAAQSQLALASMHTDFSQTGINDEDLSEARRHSEHVINILVGEEGEFFGDLDGDNLPQNPGDGVGARVYVQSLADELEAAMQTLPLTPESLFAADRLLVSTQNTLDQIDVSLKKALQIFAADTAVEADPFVRELTILLNQAQNGLDLDGNGSVDPVENEGGFSAVQTYLRLLSEVPLFEVSAQTE